MKHLAEINRNMLAESFQEAESSTAEVAQAEAQAEEAKEEAQEAVQEAAAEVEAA